MLEAPEISVIIPTRDRWPLLASSALPAALKQEDVDPEVIVVDDGSADETPARPAELEYMRLRVLRHERSLVHFPAREILAEAPRQLVPGAVRRLLRRIQRQPEAGSGDSPSPPAAASGQSAE